jgi:hypothetical protein
LLEAARWPLALALVGVSLAVSHAVGPYSVFCRHVKSSMSFILRGMSTTYPDSLLNAEWDDTRPEVGRKLEPALRDVCMNDQLQALADESVDAARTSVLPPLVSRQAEV